MSEQVVRKTDHAVWFATRADMENWFVKQISDHLIDEENRRPTDGQQVIVDQFDAITVASAGFDPRVVMALQKNDVRTLQQLAAMTESQALRLKTVGPTFLEEIRKKLIENKMNFRPEEDQTQKLELYGSFTRAYLSEQFSYYDWALRGIRTEKVVETIQEIIYRMENNTI